MRAGIRLLHQVLEDRQDAVEIRVVVGQPPPVAEGEDERGGETLAVASPLCRAQQHVVQKRH